MGSTRAALLLSWITSARSRATPNCLASWRLVTLLLSRRRLPSPSLSRRASLPCAMRSPASRRITSRLPVLGLLARLAVTHRTTRPQGRARQVHPSAGSPAAAQGCADQGAEVRAQAVRCDAPQRLGGSPRFRSERWPAVPAGARGDSRWQAQRVYPADQQLLPPRR